MVDVLLPCRSCEPSPQPHQLGRGVAIAIGLIVGSWLPLNSLRGADFDEVRQAYFSGDYKECIELCRAEVERGIWNDFWARQLMRCLLTTGEYQQASEVFEAVEEKFSNSIPLRIMAAEAYRFTGRGDQASRLLNAIPEAVNRAPWRFNDRDNALALGQFFLDQGADARQVLDAFYDRVLKGDPSYVDAHKAIGRLALQKTDYQEAVVSLEKALELQPEDPDIHFLLYRAWAPSDSKKAESYLEQALKRNPTHLESLLAQARMLIDAEQYSAADRVLAEVLSVNPKHPLGYALKAAIAHLRGEYILEGEMRVKALAHWKLNPEVDYLIGEMLSKHYRFEEGVKYQRRALQMDPQFSAAKFQLAQDLLRCGRDEEGWLLADQVATEDPYNVVAFNLRTLRDRLAQYTTLKAPGLIVRMDSREAKIYGERVVRLLQEAQQTLARKYEMELPQPTTVEIFAQQSDFAIRTFGLPGGAGYLGVCFGPVVTANSPASQGDSPANWESVLWHEFCHVITLQKTQNRMPRWLSEGISVYEEVERDPRWGQSMTPNYRTMLLSEDFVPLSQLSGAFLNPKSGMHLDFAYFESSLAVRYLIEQHGLPRLLKLLTDLGVGVTLEEAFSRLYGDREKLDADFEAYARGLAHAYLPDLDFGEPELPNAAAVEDLIAFVDEHPNSYFGRLGLVRALIKAGRLEQALHEARALDSFFPDDVSPGGVLELLLSLAMRLQDQELELQTLERITAISSDNVAALTKLIQLARQSTDWSAVREYADQLLQVQPLVPDGHENLALAAEKLGTPQDAIGALRALQEMEPLDPAGLHFRLAQGLAATDQPNEAKRQVLQALEYSPRYRAAQKLLTRLARRDAGTATQWEVASPKPGSPPKPKTSVSR